MNAVAINFLVSRFEFLTNDKIHTINGLKISIIHVEYIKRSKIWPNSGLQVTYKMNGFNWYIFVWYAYFSSFTIDILEMWANYGEYSSKEDWMPESLSSLIGESEKSYSSDSEEL